MREPATNGSVPVDAHLAGLALLGRAVTDGHGAVLGVDGALTDVRLLGYHPGQRATLRLTIGGTVLIAKAFRRRAARLHDTLATLGARPVVGVRTPRVVAFRPEAELIITDAFPPTTVLDLVTAGNGERAGMLAARWLTAPERRDIGVGRPYHASESLPKIAARAATFTDRAAAVRLERLLVLLRDAIPAVGPAALMHGSLRHLHLHDCGDAVGLVDWDGHRQGDWEYDIGTFLATSARLGLEEPALVPALAAAEQVVRIRTNADGERVRFYEALGLAKVAGKLGQLPSSPPGATVAAIERAERMLLATERVA